MPHYRVFYVGRSPNGPGTPDWWRSEINAYGVRRTPHLSKTEFEDVIEARNPAAALEQFFENHVERREDVQYLGRDFKGHPIRGVEDYRPEYTYLWIEDDMMMEYQGVDEMTPGLVSCPLCNGSGEVDSGVAEYWDETLEAQEKGA